jgi:hypothetical protein
MAPGLAGAAMSSSGADVTPGRGVGAADLTREKDRIGDLRPRVAGIVAQTQAIDGDTRAAVRPPMVGLLTAG